LAAPTEVRPVTDETGAIRRAVGVLSRYSVDAAAVHGELPASKRNQNLLVEDSDGHLYVLRHYRRNPDIARIRFQLRFQEHLRSRGIPTSRVIETSDGESLVTDRAEAYALFDYVAGTDYDFANREHAREAASWLARLHQAAESFSDGPPSKLDTIPDVHRWWTHGEREVAKLEEFFHSRDVREELAFVRCLQRELVQECPPRTLDALPQVWVHGDYHGRNVVFRGNHLAAVFDFDVVHRGFRVEDVAYGLFAFARRQRGSNRLRADVARLFIGEYDRVYPLTRQELEVLPAIGVVVHARTAPRYALRERLGEDPAEALKEHVRVMRSLHEIASSLPLPTR
jgi:Ser/Thr protein kinase RdoA (MazF antagonist)